MDEGQNLQVNTAKRHLQSRNLLYESSADRLQGVLRPGVEPVDSCAVHQSGKLPCTSSQCEPNWRETQDNLQARVVPDSVMNKERMLPQR